MGYDMTCEGAHPNVDAVRERLRSSPNGQRADAYQELLALERSENSYFRLNIFGMGAYRSQMDAVGMLVWPDEVNYDAEGVIEADSGDRIPGHKLCSNDGWLVTPSEIRLSLQEWDDYCDGGGPLLGIEDEEYWDQWIAFLRHTAEHGGFRVY